MHQGKLVFAQLMLYLPLSTFRRCVADHRGSTEVKDFSCLDQFFAMAFAQLTYGESLRDIEVQPARSGSTAVPHGVSLPDDFAQHAGQCERHAPMANLCPLCSAPHWPGPSPVRQGAVWTGTRRCALRVRRQHHRPVPVGVCLGCLSLDQGRHQAAHAAGLERQHPQFHSHHRRQDARGQCAGRSGAGAGGVLFDGIGAIWILPACS